MSLIVTPEVLRTTQQAIESALEQATSIANGYLSTHEGLGSAVWGSWPRSTPPAKSTSNSSKPSPAVRDSPTASARPLR